jgi:tetratricopeptide (TPR) repeat protein
MAESPRETAIRRLEDALSGPLDEDAATAASARLATLYAARREGNRADNLDRAVELLRRVVADADEAGDPHDRGVAHHNLGSALVERLRGDRAADLEEAIAHLKEALRLRPRETEPERWAETQNNLGSAFRLRIAGDPAENAELAIEHVRAALEVRTREAAPREWAISQNDLAIAYLARVRGDASDDVERAIQHLALALGVHTRDADPERWAEAEANLALAHVRRVRGNRAANLRLAAQHGERALEAYDEALRPLEWANVNNTLAVIRQELGEPERSIEHLEAVLRALPREDFPERWAAAHLNLLHSYLALPDTGRAIEHGRRALEIFDRERFPDRWGMVHQGLGVAAAARGEPEAAEANFRLALDVFGRESPARHRTVQRSLAGLLFDRGDWAGAHAAFDAAIGAGDDLLAEAYTDEGRASELAEASTVFARDAWCLVELDRPDEALERLDRGKARQLTEALMLSDAVEVRRSPELEQLRATLRALELEERTSDGGAAAGLDRAGRLQAVRAELRAHTAALRESDPSLFPPGLDVAGLARLAPAGGALVAPLVASHGSVALVLRAGGAAVDVVPLGDFDERELQVLLFGAGEGPWEGWLGAYGDGADPDRRRALIEAAGAILWSRVAGPLVAGLRGLGIERGAPLVVFPQGGLGLLPLHTAFRLEDGRRLALVDEHPVSYAPGGYALAAGLRRLGAGGDDRSLAAVADPTRDLPHAAEEGAAVRGHFPPGDSVVLADATLADVLREARGRTHLHFACHGEYDWDDPMRSALLLARGDRLTLAAAIARLDLRGVRLVTLSACETGMTDVRRSPDEYVGLPAGFLQAEAPAVVSTLWAVDDFSTLLLMERFYELQAAGGLSPSRALAGAQTWLRDATNAELGPRLGRLRDRAENAGRITQLLRRQFRRVSLGDPKERPFAELYHWGAFAHWGADAG